MMIQQRQFRQSCWCTLLCIDFLVPKGVYIEASWPCIDGVCLDDKHHGEVEPGLTVASVTLEIRLKCVKSWSHTSKVWFCETRAYWATEHDFTRFSLIPSVILLIDIPDEIDESWYEGEAHVGFKDAVFEPSSCSRHLCEFHDNMLLTRMGNRSVLFVYTDGGPDHRTTLYQFSFPWSHCFWIWIRIFSLQLEQHLINPGEIQLNALCQ